MARCFIQASNGRSVDAVIPTLAHSEAVEDVSVVPNELITADNYT